MINKVCKKCKTQLSDFFQTGMLGCPDCYRAFSDEIEGGVCGLNKYYNHKGKKPKFGNLDKQLLKEYQMLLKEKEKAAIDGKFDQMKEISEQIYALQEEIKLRGLL